MAHKVHLFRDCRGCRLPGVIGADRSVSRARCQPQVGDWYICSRCGEVYRATLAEPGSSGCEVVTLWRVPEDQLGAVDEFVLRVRASALATSAMAA